MVNLPIKLADVDPLWGDLLPVREIADRLRVTPQAIHSLVKRYPDRFGDRRCGTGCIHGTPRVCPVPMLMPLEGERISDREFAFLSRELPRPDVARILGLTPSAVFQRQQTLKRKGKL